eukprot:5716536-Heterocapsa_arctica.AAC.1
MPAVSNGSSIQLWGSSDPICVCVLNVNHSQTRKSRLTGQAEALCGCVDTLSNKSLLSIWNAKLKVMAAINAAKRRKKDACQEEGAPDAEPEDPDGANFPGAFSIAFLGGTIERVKERCAGDCPTVRQTKTVQRLPGLTAEQIARDCPGLNAAEKAIALKPGMSGRGWFGNALVYDE